MTRAAFILFVGGVVVGTVVTLMALAAAAVIGMRREDALRDRLSGGTDGD